MILETVVDTAPSGRYRKAAQSARYDGDDRPRSLQILSLQILSGLTFSTVAVLAGFIVWACLA